jgi:exonuclease I
MSNEAKMTVEERIIQEIKKHTVATLIADEDSLIELARDALHDLLHKPRKEPASDRYSQPVVRVSAIQEAAYAVSKEVATELAKQEAERLLANEDFKLAVSKAILAHVPAAIMQNVQQICDLARNEAARESIVALNSYLYNGGEIGKSERIQP